MTYLLTLLLCCLALTSCGRKQRTLFQFNEQETVHINRLSLPAVQELKAQRIDTGVLLTWAPFEQPITYTRDNDTIPVQLDGYNVFKLSKNNFIPKNPINKKLILEASYTEKIKLKKECSSYYLVRPIFRIQNQTVIGVSSAIARVQ